MRTVPTNITEWNLSAMLERLWLHFTRLKRDFKAVVHSKIVIIYSPSCHLKTVGLSVVEHRRYFERCRVFLFIQCKSMDSSGFGSSKHLLSLKF